MARNIKYVNLGLSSPLVTSSVPPENTDVLWRDTSGGSGRISLKFYDGINWVDILRRDTLSTFRDTVDNPSSSFPSVTFLREAVNNEVTIDDNKRDTEDYPYFASTLRADIINIIRAETSTFVSGGGVDGGTSTQQIRNLESRVEGRLDGLVVAADGAEKYRLDGENLKNVSVRGIKIAPNTIQNDNIIGISGSKVSAGIDASNITTGILPLGVLSGITGTQMSSSAGIQSGQITSLSASKITGTLNASRIPNLDASKITGTLNASRIPDLDAGKITTGFLPLGVLSGITGTQMSSSAGIQSGQIASLHASKITDGILPLGVLSGITNAQIAANAGIDGSKIEHGIYDAPANRATRTDRSVRSGGSGAENNHRILEFKTDLLVPSADPTYNQLLSAQTLSITSNGISGSNGISVYTFKVGVYFYRTGANYEVKYRRLDKVVPPGNPSILTHGFDLYVWSSVTNGGFFTSGSTRTGNTDSDFSFGSTGANNLFLISLFSVLKPALRSVGDVGFTGFTSATLATYGSNVLLQWEHLTHSVSELAATTVEADNRLAFRLLDGKPVFGGSPLTVNDDMDGYWDDFKLIRS